MTYEELVESFQAEHPEVEASKMFGMPVMKVGGKAFCGDWQGDMNFKLAPSEVTAALKLPGAALFDPMGGRPMKEWVVVPQAQSSEWGRLAEAALDYVASKLK